MFQNNVIFFIIGTFQKDFFKYEPYFSNGCRDLMQKAKYEPYFSSGCRDLMQKATNFNGAAIFLLKEVIIEFTFYI